MNRHRLHFPEGGRAMLQIMTVLGAGLIGLMHPTPSHATLLDFTFSFTGTVPPGNVAGTVTGEIFGLTEGATSSATNVIVDTYPAGLEPPSPPQTLFTGIVENTFTVTPTGTLTSASYMAFDDTKSFLIDLNREAGVNALVNITTTNFTANFNGFAGATYTLVQSIPEPSSVTLLGIGLGAAALWQLRRRRQRGAAA